MSAAVPTGRQLDNHSTYRRKWVPWTARERRPSPDEQYVPHPEELPNFYAWRMVVAAPRRERRQGARRIAKAFKPIVVVFAALYFLVDAIFLSLIRPLGTWLSKLPIFRWIGSWIRSLGPYPTLALFAVPLIVLEPVTQLVFILSRPGM